MTEREQELRCVISDLRDELQEKDDQLEAAQARIAELTEQNRLLQSKLLDARLGAGRQRIEQQIEGEL